MPQTCPHAGVVSIDECPYCRPKRVLTDQQRAREAINDAGVKIVAAGFEAIDELVDGLVETGKRRLKRQVLNLLMKPGKGGRIL